MNSIVRIEYYIEEYNNGIGLCARIRDKDTNKKVSLSGNEVNKEHFLEFLSQAKIHKEVMPTVYQRDGENVIAIFLVEWKRKLKRK